MGDAGASSVARGINRPGRLEVAAGQRCVAVLGEGRPDASFTATCQGPEPAVSYCVSYLG